MKEDVFTVSNFISLMRVLVLPFMVSAMASGNRPTLAVLVVVVALSDFLDGWIARRFGIISDVGKVLDPAADKICLFVLSMALYFYTDFPLWALVMLLGKDILIAFGGALITRKERVPITPNFWGKATAAIEFITYVIFAFGLTPLKIDALIVMTFFVAVSFLTYLAIFIQIVCGNKSVEQIVKSYSAYGLTKGKTIGQKTVNIFIYALCTSLFLWLIWLVWHHWGELIK